MYSQAVSFALMFLKHGIEIVRLLNWLTKTSTILYLLQFVGSLWKSIKMCCYGLLGMGNSLSKLGVLSLRIFKR